MTADEPEAYRDDSLRSIGVSPRERLERIEAMLVKIDEKMDRRFEGLEKRVWSLEINVAPATGRLEDNLHDHHEKLKEMDDRLEGVRRWMWTAVGALFAFSFFVQFGVAHHWF